MGHFWGSGCLILLIMVVSIQTQKKPSISLSSKCLGNIMRVDTSPLGGNLLEVSAGINNTAIPLTPRLAAQCGFSMKLHPLGNATIYASLQSCFAENVKDTIFTTLVHLRLHGNHMVEDELYKVAKTCQYTTWASREILCDRNYMEVSVRRAIPDDYTLPDHPVPRTIMKSSDPRRAANAEKHTGASGFKISTIVFYTPEMSVMTVAQAQGRGYGITNTPTRLVLRSPHNAPETYTQDVAGVPMTVLKTSTIFQRKWLVTQIDSAVACPTSGSVSFTPHMITWTLPWHIDPLISSKKFRLLEVHMGIDGQRLATSEMAVRQYAMSVNEMYVVIEIPVGAVGGYFKSHVVDDQYVIAYTIEPMIELMWLEDEDEAHEETSYKVLFPITTPLISRPPEFLDDTVPAEMIFKVLLGPLGSDVALVNVSFSTQVLSVAECNIRGYNIQEQSHNASKAYSLQVPFADPVVLKRKDLGVTSYSLHMTFGLLVLPEFSSFAHSVFLKAAVVDLIPPSVYGGCDNENFYVTVKYGSQGFNFQTLVGKRILTPALAEEYSFTENGTHFSFAVPFSATDVAFEAVKSSSIRSRLTVALRNPETNTDIEDFSVACTFNSILTECFSNGTITAMAVKLEAVPNLNPSQLTLRDPKCGPISSDDRFASFVFTGSSCGTTRKFFSDVMVYENEISLPDDLEYELKVTCYYDVNTAYSVAFLIRPRNNEPYAEPAKGELQVVMRLARDESYNHFHGDEEYPISTYLRHPLYFEMELKSANLKLELKLENCWATLGDRTSLPRWNLIIRGCHNPMDPYHVVFHTVRADARIQNPAHFKRFEVPMFAFSTEEDNLSSKIFVHCDVVICDMENPVGGPCDVQCSNQNERIKGQKRSAENFKYVPVVFGPILLWQAK